MEKTIEKTIKKVKDVAIELKNDYGIKGILLALFIFIIFICLILAFGITIMGLLWAVTAGIIYYGASFLGYAVTYKVAYGAAMILSVIGGVLRGPKIISTAKTKD